MDFIFRLPFLFRNFTTFNFWGAVIGGALGLIGALKGGHDAKKGSEAQAESAGKATDVQWQMYERSRKDQMPWLKTGRKALGAYWNEVTGGESAFNPETEPGYKFGYEEFVEKPTLRTASATGRLGSGRTQKELTRYASDYASTKYDNWLSRLAQIAGFGYNAGTNLGTQALNTGTNVGNTLMAQGDARASGYLSQGNIYGNALSQIGQNVMDYYATRNIGNEDYLDKQLG
jgi:hypothetical protein